MLIALVHPLQDIRWYGTNIIKYPCYRMDLSDPIPGDAWLFIKEQVNPVPGQRHVRPDAPRYSSHRQQLRLHRR